MCFQTMRNIVVKSTCSLSFHYKRVSISVGREEQGLVLRRVVNALTQTNSATRSSLCIIASC
ncbi:Uncharacterized protein APZ42_027573 [Daphnia magna]|uniref:Uncharacterized protein n=1 Tax=Daphnia magna TaxID=35525 RepID=A0A164R8S9_9CRUS|nr:Uncharacterized protein APZ42_027573 [Daphnia magna]